jgi:adenylylsulfate kinase-like enzyme
MIPCIWLTGLPGSGKSTMARYIQHRLNSRRVASVIIDGDDLRRRWGYDLGFNDEDRTKQAARATDEAVEAIASGRVPIVALVSPRQAVRDWARHHLGGALKVVHTYASQETLTLRRPSLYRKVRSGALMDWVPHEAPTNPYVSIDSDEASPGAASKYLVDRIWEDRVLGFGDLVQRVAELFGFDDCNDCKKRQATLNRWLPLHRVKGVQ